jgi:hypothetical protein
MSIADTLINNKIPDFMKSYPNTIGYLRAVGDFLDDTKTVIDDLKFTGDYKRGTSFNIASALRSEGLELPANTENIPRIILRDLMKNFVRKGTLDSITWALKVLDVQFEVHQMWIPNPEDIQIGYYRGFGNDRLSAYVEDDYVEDGYVIGDYLIRGNPVRYNEHENSYKDYMYGESYVDSEGNTYFKGSSYEWLNTLPEDRDEYVREGYHVEGYTRVSNENQAFQFYGIPILGESYPTIQEQQNRVSATPHFLIRITYPEAPSELTTFLIDELTMKKNRPTHTRLIVEII